MIYRKIAGIKTSGNFLSFMHSISKQKGRKSINDDKI